ncbi:ATP-binding protein [Acetobacteraceae bacterium]|nr:ATP-binding protein [Acetobacteraceae bacterium]
MTTGQHLISLLYSHIEKNDEQLFSVALQAAANEARRGHSKIAQEIKKLVETARLEKSKQQPTPTPIIQPRGELADLFSASYPQIRLASMILPKNLEEKLQRVLLEQRQAYKLQKYGFFPRRKLLLTGPPGSGKTMTAHAIAGMLKLPLFVIRYETLMTRYMGETASKLRQIFDAISEVKGVYFFDEFDALGARRDTGNDVGEIKRVLNSFLQFLENDASTSLIMAATNHPKTLDTALFRRFDDILEYHFPTNEIACDILKQRLISFLPKKMNWDGIAHKLKGLSQAELVKVAEDCAKEAILSDKKTITKKLLLKILEERQETLKCRGESLPYGANI